MVRTFLIQINQYLNLSVYGRSYNALDSWGQMYVWGELYTCLPIGHHLKFLFSGTLNGEGGALRSDGFSISQKIAESPLKLKLPEPIVSLR